MDPVEAVWDTTLTSYCSVMGLVVLHYDCLLTLEHEVRLVWRGDLSFVKVLYFINRYLPAVVMIFSNYAIASFRPALSRELCQVSLVVSSTSYSISSTAGTAILSLRVTALYNGARTVIICLWIAFALLQGLRLAMGFFGVNQLFRSLVYSPLTKSCVPKDTGYRSAALIAVPGIYDFILLVLTLIKGARHALTLRKQGSPIMYTLLRDEILYFFCISSLRIFNAIVWLALPPPLILVGIYAEWGLESTLTSRFFLNLRDIAFRQPATAASTDRVVSTLLTSRTRPSVKPPSGLTAAFLVESGPVKNFRNSGISNEYLGDEQYPEAVRLEVMGSQTRLNGGGNDDLGSSDGLHQKV